jgi:hypothetical protein
LGQYEVFVSSDAESIRLGRKWLDEIDGSLTDCKIILVLCSPESIVRPWINFETGCGWIKKIPIIPICHSGLVLKSLPPPLGFLQGIELADDAVLDKLLKNLAKELGVQKAPLVHPDMLQHLRKAETATHGESSEPGILTYYKEISGRNDSFDDNDYMNMLDSWFMQLTLSERERVISFPDIDKKLSLTSGNTKRLLKNVVSKRSYEVLNEGANTITFKYSRGIGARSRFL